MGGAQLYRQAMDLVDKLYITHIDNDFEGDCFFRPIDKNKWKMLREIPERDGENNIRFCIYKKLNSY